MESSFLPQPIFVSKNKTLMDTNTKQSLCKDAVPDKTNTALLLDTAWLLLEAGLFRGRRSDKATKALARSLFLHLFHLRVTRTAIMLPSASASCWPGIILTQIPDFPLISASSTGLTRPMHVALKEQRPGKITYWTSKKISHATD